ncbi:Uma2 family endonuclease [Thermostichus vulcanus]|uniref:Uma2 family endonuclease n=1 Tax=Thermostichus vulcanus str. 'Rupite' TaxID=2813851 RepID=A0ABT0C751_THEVL|nr:Uma2 family endonuclease [Thermostichus vulcanus]MCJ2541629.1 Uma2 family endonuclease [Thermostichus vulcanus str. 'Rupite']
MVSLSTKPLTLEEFLQQPETQPASEFIEGEIIQKPMPQGKHSRIQLKLGSFINEALEPPRVAMALPELCCTFAGRAIVPDISVITWDRIPVDEDGTIQNLIPFCPDWVIEVLSPDQNQTKLIKKVLSCLAHGCQMGWIVDPEEKMVLTYPAQQQPTLHEDPQDMIQTPAFAQGIQLTVETLFGWMQVNQ